MNNSVAFYLDRVCSAPAYGFKAGHEIINAILRAIDHDSSLTDEEYDRIIKTCHQAHITMMEDNYNDGWYL